MEDPKPDLQKGDRWVPFVLYDVSPSSRLLLSCGAMTVGHVLLAASTTIFALTLSVRATTAVQIPAGSAPASTHVATLPPTTSADYLGSKACARCHQEDFDQWQRSLHIRMTKPIDEATVVGDFTEGTRFADHGRSFEFGRSNGKPYMRVSYGGGKPETFSIDYTLGHKRYQGYLSRLEDGRMYVLPAFWHIESKRWIDWKEITPVPDDAHNLRQIWNTNCFNCHATNLAQGFELATRRYETTWTEMGIGCEACHGPGRPHVELMDQWEKDPASKPAYDNSAKNRDLSSILKTFSPRSAPPRQTFDTCAYCHGNKRNAFLGFRGGDRYEDYALPFLISAPIPENDLQGEFWPDGRPNRFNRPQALTITGCFKAGQAVCTNCHVAHGSRNPFSLKLNITQGRNGDLLCLQCHQASAAGAAGADGCRETERVCSIDRIARRDRALAGQRSRGAHVSQSGVGRQPVHQLPHERCELATLDSAARSHVPGAGSGDHRRLWRAERLHHVSRQSLTRMGGATDGPVVGQRRSPSGGTVAGDDDVPSGFG